ncbi:PRC-barrel domain-containing protein [Solwaraspora sp. WMMD1047]|uniref:PRC-barrel domain-containing protein n=1 Tax=Solwaraspora sp. WMMD1047 TaxID=3016102 RepID=UPI002415A5B1|nr:PRC-barrel domain-containing protein [Solwaraspora sp. WMMD1047]MDG4829308.1 PRC-barrel domain-containing protein [Solwaraspora sp. WMMD1047]
MRTHGIAKLRKLSDTTEALADPAEDIRGRKVHDKQDNDIGKVDDLLIDENEHKVRLLRVEHGGILGFGATASFIPVDAVTRITDEVVYVDVTRERVSGAPRYDPDIVDQADVYEDLYGYYGFAPFWGPGYMYPGYPLYR